MCNTANDLRTAGLHTYVRVLLEGGMEGEWAVDGHKLAKILFYEFGQRLVKVKVFFFAWRGRKKIRIAPETLRINQ